MRPIGYGCSKISSRRLANISMGLRRLSQLFAHTNCGLGAGTWSCPNALRPGLAWLLLFVATPALMGSSAAAFPYAGEESANEFLKHVLPDSEWPPPMPHWHNAERAAESPSEFARNVDPNDRRKQTSVLRKVRSAADRLDRRSGTPPPSFHAYHVDVIDFGFGKKRSHSRVARAATGYEKGAPARRGGQRLRTLRKEVCVIGCTDALHAAWWQSGQVRATGCARGWVCLRMWGRDLPVGSSPMRVVAVLGLATGSPKCSVAHSKRQPAAIRATCAVHRALLRLRGLSAPDALPGLSAKSRMATECSL